MNIKSISHLKANAADILAELKDGQDPLIITQNGEAAAVLQDISSFEATQETLALLKLLALGMKDVESGASSDARAAIEALRPSANT